MKKIKLIVFCLISLSGIGCSGFNLSLGLPLIGDVPLYKSEPKPLESESKTSAEDDAEKKREALRKEKQEILASARNSAKKTVSQSEDATVKAVMPEGWSKWVSGADQSAYEVGTDMKIFRSEPKSYYIKSVASLPPKSNGQVNQVIQADAYRGKRIRVSVFLRGENIKEHGWLYLQANDSKAIRGGADHRMANNSLDWIKCEVVMDVPENSKKVSYGIALNGEGQIWFDDLNLEVVGKDVPETWLYLKEEASKPSNLP